MAQKIIGREKEQQELLDLYHSGRPEFVVVQGRRRVGKTYLVRELLDGQMTFYHTGLSPAEVASETGGMLR
ncbi:MAG: AAA family ATPase, partial [Bacteroides sp.]